MRIAVTALTYAHGGAVELRTTGVVASSMRGEPWTSSSVPPQSLAGEERTSPSPASSSPRGRQRAVRRRHRGTDLPALPRRQPRPGRDLVTDLGERHPRAQLFATYEAALTDPQVQRHTAMRQVLNRQTGRSFTRGDITPHEGQPPSTATLCTRTTRPPSGSNVTFKTRNPGSANSNVVLSIIARDSLQLTALGTKQHVEPRASNHGAAPLKYQAALPG
jgi:hypothetical protein